MNEVERLLVQAFEQARDTGKLDWSRMTTAVLKNRILSLTGNRFRETDYGADTFREFVSKFDDIVALDAVTFPPVVILKEEVATKLVPSGESGPSRHPRIRSDLWQAVIDRSSGKTYLWNPNTTQARPGLPEEGHPILPTVDEDTDSQWREDFTSSLGTSITDAEAIQVSQWSEHLLPTFHLPRRLIHLWNRFLSNQVNNRLLDWFEQEGLDTPDDFVVTGSVNVSPDTEALRRLVMRVVGEMTEQELSQLVLPPRAVLKATRSRQR